MFSNKYYKNFKLIYILIQTLKQRKGRRNGARRGGGRKEEEEREREEGRGGGGRCVGLQWWLEQRR